MFQQIAQVVVPLARHAHGKAEVKQLHWKSIMRDAMSSAQSKKKRKFNPAVHFNAKLQVVGSGSPGVPAAVYLLATQTNYLVNCGEGTQRLSQEYRCKLSKLSNIFLTHLTWKNVGGLSGVLLTAQSNGLERVNIHCPEGLQSFVETVKTFINLTQLEINFLPVDEARPYEDGVMKVRYVPLVKSLPDDEAEKEEEEKEKESGETNVNGKRTAREEAEEEHAKKKSKISPLVVCYIFRIHERRGKLLISKCIDHGIPPGPLFNMLKQGLSVTKEDGTVVTSADVCMPSSSKSTVIAVECPTEEYLDSLTRNEAFSKYYPKAPSNGRTYVFHFTPEEIMSDARYQKWMKQFHETTEHVILNEANVCRGSAAVYKNQYILNMMHPSIFPLFETDEFLQDKETENEFTHRGRACDSIELRPEPKSFTKGNVYLAAQTYLDEIRAIPSLPEALTELKERIEKKSAELNLASVPEYPEIVMLGTGCSVPNKVRNTSCTLVRITENSSMILDCGEGTLGQIIRLYGIAKANAILRTIKAIYISHVHADHHMGLIGLLLYRKKLTTDSLFLLAPKNLMPWLNFYNERFEPINEQYTTISNSDLYLNYHRMPKTLETVLYASLGVSSINTVYVAHCNMSTGISITFADKKKLCYSGDTMFSENLISLGKQCDLLIHEATMEDGLEQLAKRNFHSTTSEAIKAGKLMNAKFILLTHFSQRYSKIPYLPENETNVGLAYDNMRLKLSELPLLPLFYPCMKIMFQEYSKLIDK